jgi:multidrug efflux pump
MLISDVSVKRPVFATVISLLLLAFGILSFYELPLREYPNISSPVVGVTTTYRGASAQIIETRITEILEDQISGIEGVKSITSRSEDGRSNISIEFDLDRDIDEAANDVRDKVARNAGRLPAEADPPSVSKSDSDSRPIQWFSLTSDTMGIMALTDFADRYLVDQFTGIDGVANVFVSGAGRYSMRVWIDRTRSLHAALLSTTWNRRCAARTLNCPLVESTHRNGSSRSASNAPIRPSRISNSWSLPGGMTIILLS